MRSMSSSSGTVRAQTVLQQGRGDPLRIALENRGLAAGTINGRLAAGRRLAYEAADAGLLSPELAAGIRRVKGSRNSGSTWNLAQGRGGTPALAGSR